MSKRESFIYLIFSIAIFIYLAIRSSTVGIVNDEAASFLNYMRTGNIFPFTEHHLISANNHILNSLLGWFSYQCFGIDEWVIRLPNLLSFILFSWSIYKIGQNLKTVFFRWFLWLTILGTHYLIEFFAYSRGYGLGLAFIACAIVFLLQSQEKKRNQHLQLYLALLMVSLATLANLNLLLSFLIIVGLSIPHLIKNLSWKWLTLYSTTFLISLFFFYSNSQQLQAHEELYFGQSNLKLTFYTLLYPLTSLQAEHTSYMVMLCITIFFSLFTLILIVQSVVYLAKLKTLELNPLFIFLGLFLLNVVGNVLLHWVMDVKYPSSRTGLHWYFLFAGLVPFAIQSFKKTQKTIFAMALLLFIPIVGFSLCTVNLYHSADPLWTKEQLSDELVTAIHAQNRDVDFPLSMQSSNGIYANILAFKNFQQENKLAVCDDFLLGHPMFVADLVLIDTVLLPQLNLNYHQVFYDTHSTMSLYRRNVILEKHRLADTAFQQAEFSNDAFTNLMTKSIHDSIVGKAFRVDYVLNSTSEKVPMPSYITLEMRDIEGNITWYKQQRIDYHYLQNGNDTLKLSFISPKIPPQTVQLRSYFWNLHNGKFKINSSKTLFSLLTDD